MERVKVSVITVSFNSMETIGSTVLSVNKQIYKNIEHILIDGKSEDNTVSIFKKLSKRENFIISETDTGLYDAMNKGIFHSSGDFILFLNSDDIFSTKYSISKLVENILSESSVVYGNTEFLNKNGNKMRYWSPGFVRGGKLSGWHPPHPSLMASKTVLNEIGGFNTKYSISADYDLILRLMAIGKLTWHWENSTIVSMKIGGKSTSFKGIIDSFSQLIKIYHNLGLSNFEVFIKLTNRYIYKLHTIVK